MINSYTVISKNFEELTKTELYAILALRVQVFCVEQNCPYQDLDGQDRQAQHVFIKDGENINVDTAYDFIPPKMLHYNHQTGLPLNVLDIKFRDNK